MCPWRPTESSASTPPPPHMYGWLAGPNAPWDLDGTERRSRWPDAVIAHGFVFPERTSCHLRHERLTRLC